MDYKVKVNEHTGDGHTGGLTNRDGHRDGGKRWIDNEMEERRGV